MPTHCNTAFECLEAIKILEDSLPEKGQIQLHDQQVYSQWQVWYQQSGMRQNSSLILKSTYAQRKVLMSSSRALKGYHVQGGTQQK